MTRFADETMDDYLARTVAVNMSRVVELPLRSMPEHILTTRAIPTITKEKGYMKVLNEYEKDELMHDAHLGLVEVPYARYDSETNTIQCTIKLKEGVMPPYLLERQLRPIEPEDIKK